MPITLGTKVKDVITGFQGIAISRTEFLHGCTRITVQPQELHEGKPVEAQWFDEPQVQELGGKPPVTSVSVSAKPGGPQRRLTIPSTPPRR